MRRKSSSRVDTTADRIPIGVAVGCYDASMASELGGRAGGTGRRVRLGWEALGTVTMAGTLFVIVLDPIGSAVRAVSVGFVLALMVAVWLALGRVGFERPGLARWLLVGLEGTLLLVAVALDANAAYLLLAWSFLAYVLLAASVSVPVVMGVAALVGLETHLLPRPPVPWATIVSWYVPDIAAGTMLAVFLERTRRHEELLRHTIDELRAAQTTMRELAYRMGELHERERLAARIHETVAQHLVGILLLVRGEAPTEGARLIEEASLAGLEATRSLIRELRRREESPEALADVVLVEAARLRAAGLEVEVVGDLEGLELPPMVLDLAARLLAEGSTNVLRHAIGATRVRLEARLEGAQLVLGVVDDGAAPADPRQLEGHLGLALLAERVERLGGLFEAHPREHGGFELAARLPYRMARAIEEPAWTA
ncbi:putative signal transduction histidine kinase [Acidimicrobium ferrooxidans DSM 10331]|uniref:Putative signal transduction histidine kinase n=1 Tax=Acidimicrobium ferrooxidans (strain DSM 10331 / JCM 15462 / NBRC 103882 / ICP) TaxID=525909 RepID=C7M1Y8_ACIFD|nr:signal transduction histidine kinase [Acidimicrobium ferrooxidans]ACU54885.1 putative signal transduction histidine kinase [Acidimicrobium ferrooxidans DSM 10331]